VNVNGAYVVDTSKVENLPPPDFQTLAAAAIVVVTLTPGKHPTSLLELTQRLEYEMITAALDQCGGNCAQAARLLGIKRTRLVMRRRKYALPMRVQPKQLTRTALEAGDRAL
jgi:DNA-binding NtrC family response regulator